MRQRLPNHLKRLVKIKRKFNSSFFIHTILVSLLCAKRAAQKAALSFLVNLPVNTFCGGYNGYEAVRGIYVPGVFQGIPGRWKQRRGFHGIF